MSKPTSEQLQAWTEYANHEIARRGLKRIPRDVFRELSEHGVKRCPTCQTVKLHEGFAKHSGSSDGRSTNCRECHSGYHEANRDHELKRMARYRDNNRDRLREQNLAYHASKPWVSRIADGKRRAQEWGAHWEEFTYQDLLDHWESVGIDPWISVYSGLELTVENYGLDHVIPLSNTDGPGHVVSNLVPCTKDENRRKHNHWFVNFVTDNATEPDANAPELVKQALEPTVPSRPRRTVLLQTTIN